MLFLSSDFIPIFLCAASPTTRTLISTLISRCFCCASQNSIPWFTNSPTILQLFPEYPLIFPAFPWGWSFRYQPSKWKWCIPIHSCTTESGGEVGSLFQPHYNFQTIPPSLSGKKNPDPPSSWFHTIWLHLNCLFAVFYSFIADPGIWFIMVHHFSSPL